MTAPTNRESLMWLRALVSTDVDASDRLDGSLTDQLGVFFKQEHVRGQAALALIDTLLAMPDPVLEIVLART